MSRPQPPKRRSRQNKPRRRAAPPGDPFDGENLGGKLDLSGDRPQWATLQDIQDEMARIARENADPDDTGSP